MYKRVVKRLLDITMLFYSMDYSMSNFEQAKAGIHRTGQEWNCHYIYLQAGGTVDVKVLHALQSKVNLATQLIDEYRKGNNLFRYKKIDSWI